MDYDALLLLASDLGYGLLESGAEIYRVEESIQRLLLAYGVAEADPFVIPNCIFVSFTTPDGAVKSQVRRMPSHGTDIELLELYNGLCRRLCAQTPPLPEARRLLSETRQARRGYDLPTLLLSYLLGAAFFSLFFGGSARDALCAAICGQVIGLVMTFLTSLHTNLFLKTMASSALSAFTALALTYIGLGQHSDLIIIGAFMALVPGVMFTNAIRDVMAGDMVAGLSRLADSLLTGVSLALGTAFALGLSRLLWAGAGASVPAQAYPYLLPVLFAFLGSGGFFAIYNIHAPLGTLICALGGALGWLTYLLTAPVLQSEISQTLAAAIVISAYAEVMARVRKCPVTSYQLLALFPLVPGAGIYYTMEYAVNGDVNAFLASLLHVLGVAGALAVGVLLVSSAVRMYITFHRQRKEAQP